MEEMRDIEELEFTITPRVEVGVMDPPCAVNCQFDTNSFAQENLPVWELYLTLSREFAHHPRPVWNMPLETVNWEVDAELVIARYVVVASVEVANRLNKRSIVEDAVARRPALNV